MQFDSHNLNKNRKLNLRLVVGLGNPGARYENTRHNAGFMIADKIARDFNISLDKKKFDCVYGRGFIEDVEVILATRENVLRIPTQVILDGSRVFVFEGDSLHERSIQTGISNWEYTEVVDGLTDGEFVVLSVDREGVEDGAVVAPDYQ